MVSADEILIQAATLQDETELEIRISRPSGQPEIGKLIFGKIGRVVRHLSTSVDAAFRENVFWRVGLGECSCSFYKCKIGIIEFDSRAKTVELKNCEIGQIEFKNQKPVDNLKVVIENCSIGTFLFPRELNAHSIEIKGSTTFDRSVVLGGIEEVLLKGFKAPNRASFAYLADWANRRNDSALAHIARRNELAIEQVQETGLTKRILWFWGFFSDFGFSPVRPLYWLLLLFGLSFVLILLTGASVALSDAQLVGWRTSLVLCDPWSGLRIAAVGALEPVISPFATLSSRRMVVPDSSWVAAFQTFQGVFSAGMILLSGFAIRRRFKVSQ
ncbi:hypothetical protein FHS89_001702 [Rubricella aquisinus]|uniref:Uncharacterized protein n=1 Tax=Rubricella aquisinus TaxID=2028108 RepID=A0A840WWY4_9RHOB|nr:hypothetical protein [Rubricella aquisinus]MBB5515690.1 hypothetical protein [Rubricella aquisinus]